MKTKHFEIKFRRSDFLIPMPARHLNLVERVTMSMEISYMQYANNNHCPLALAMKRYFKRPFYVGSSEIWEPPTHPLQLQQSPVFKIVAVSFKDKIIERDKFGLESYVKIATHFAQPWYKRIFQLYKRPAVTIKRA